MNFIDFADPTADVDLVRAGELSSAEAFQVGNMIRVVLGGMNAAGAPGVVPEVIGNLIAIVERGVSTELVETMIEVLTATKMALVSVGSHGERRIAITPVGAAVLAYRTADPPVAARSRH